MHIYIYISVLDFPIDSMEDLSSSLFKRLPEDISKVIVTFLIKNGDFP